MKATIYTPERTAATARELAGLLSQSDGEREVIEAVLLSVMTAIERVVPTSRTELQGLVVNFTANPDDKKIVEKLGALLRDGRAPDH